MEKTKQSIGRLSALPDDVVCHILSFLPTKLSVATSTLAQRWRFLWTHVPNLDLDINDHRRGTTFSEIVNRVMSQHMVQSLNTFRFSYTYHCSDYELDTWIRTAIARNVRNLDICLHYKLKLPRCLFTCKTLVDLRLLCCITNLSCGTVSLPSLKKLHLCSVRSEVNEDLPHFLCGCPVLEELIIDNIFTVDQNSDCFNLSSPTIKRLTVNFGIYCYNPGYGVKINAPALRYLQVNDSSYMRISVLPMTTIIEADICLRTYSVEDGRYIPSEGKLFDGLCNVKCLKLEGYFEEKKLIDKAIPGSIVKFDNLTKLTLKLTVDWRFLIKLLKSADNLEVLIVDNINLTWWVEPQQVPTCLLLHLRTIRTGPIVCGHHEFNMLRYFVRNAKVLEKMDFFFVNCSKAKLYVIKTILLFERGSEACELAMDGDCLRIGS